MINAHPRLNPANRQNCRWLGDIAGRILSLDRNCPASSDLQRIVPRGELPPRVEIVLRRMLAEPLRLAELISNKKVPFFHLPGYRLCGDSAARSTSRGSKLPTNEFARQLTASREVIGVLTWPSSLSMVQNPPSRYPQTFSLRRTNWKCRNS